MAKARFAHRKSIDSFLKKILDLEVFEKFKSNPKLPEVPNTFTDHNHYLRVWETLFMQETFNIIVNSKRSEDKLS